MRAPGIESPAGSGSQVYVGGRGGRSGIPSHRTYREHLVAATVFPGIEAFWELSGVGDCLATCQLPGTGFDLVIQLAALPKVRRAAGKTQWVAAWSVAGPALRPRSYLADFPLHTIGMRLRPGAARQLFKRPLGELVDVDVDLAEVAPAVVAAARSAGLDRLQDPAADPRRRSRDAFAGWARLLSDRLLSDQLAPAVSTGLAGALALARARGGQVSLDELSVAAGLSARQLERRFADEVGLSPKRFCRVERVRSVIVRAADVPAGSWATVAADHGFADQAHLIREVVAFTGLTPVQLARSVRNQARGGAAANLAQ